MHSQIRFKGELLTTCVAHVSLDTGMNGEVVVVLRPNRVSLAARLASIPGYVLVLLSYVLPEPDLRDVRTIALRATETLVHVCNLDMCDQFGPR